MAFRVSVPNLISVVLSWLLGSFVAAGGMNVREVSFRADGGPMTEHAIGTKGDHLTADHTILDLLNHPAFAGFSLCDAIHTKARSDGNDVLQALVDDPMKVLTAYGLPAEYLAGKLLTDQYLAYLQSTAEAELGQIRERQVPRGFGACWACRIGIGVAIAAVGVAIAVATLPADAEIGMAIFTFLETRGVPQAIAAGANEAATKVAGPGAIAAVIDAICTAIPNTC
jgi:hypothetical protein